jgi:hypothetical protein
MEMVGFLGHPVYIHHTAKIWLEGFLSIISELLAAQGA